MIFFLSSRRRHTRYWRDWSSDVCSSDLNLRVKQKMEKAVNGNSDEEYIGIVKEEQKGIANIMTLRRTRGVISDRKRFEFELVGDNSLSTFISQYYSTVPVIPRFIYEIGRASCRERV